MLNNVKLENTSDNRDNPATLAGVTVRRVTMMKLPPLSHQEDSVNSFPVGGDLIITNNVADCEYRMLRRGTLCGLFGSLHMSFASIA